MKPEELALLERAVVSLEGGLKDARERARKDDPYGRDLPEFINPHSPRRRDLLGRQEGGPMTTATMMLALPGARGRWRRVPTVAVAEQGDDDDGTYSLVECPCGQRPVVRRSLEKCPGCERAYYGVGLTVWVFYISDELLAHVMDAARR